MGTIDALALREIRIPLSTPFETSRGAETVKDALIVTLTREGVEAYGECVASATPGYSEETIMSVKQVIKKHLASLVLNETINGPRDFIELTQGIRGNNMAVATVEMALWDLEGKLQGKPLSMLLGGRKKAITVGVSVGIQPSREDLVHIVGGYVRDGYRRVKIKIKPGYDLEPVKALRSKFPDLPLQVDGNSAYTLDDLQIMKKLDQFRLLMIEQPLGPDDIGGHSKLQRELVTPICLDESIRSKNDAMKALEVQACRIINIKPGRVRGLGASKEIHDLCLVRRIPAWCGGMLETGIGRAFNVALASLEGFTLPSDISASRRYFKKDVITEEFELTTNGTIEVPDGPGIGVDVDRRFLDSCTVSKETLGPS